LPAVAVGVEVVFVCPPATCFLEMSFFIEILPVPGDFHHQLFAPFFLTLIESLLIADWYRFLRTVATVA